jgi:ribosome-binding protein aMBF1 (putative translation factor)
MRDATTRQEIAEFGAALRAVREKQGLSQTDLSDASGLHRTHVSRIERGLCVPRFETLMRRGLVTLADVFAVIDGDSR